MEGKKRVLAHLALKKPRSREGSSGESFNGGAKFEKVRSSCIDATLRKETSPPPPPLRPGPDQKWAERDDYGGVGHYGGHPKNHHKMFFGTVSFCPKSDHGRPFRGSTE